MQACVALYFRHVLYIYLTDVYYYVAELILFIAYLAPCTHNSMDFNNSVVLLVLSVNNELEIM
jgi:hypothetical protein